MAKQEELSLILRLKDMASSVFKTIQNTGNSFSNGMKAAMNVVADSFKNSMFSAVALGTAISNFAMQAIGSIKQWVAEAKKEFQDFQVGLTNVYTLLDKDTFNKNAKDLEAGAIKVMQDYNITINDVNKALFDSVSAGIEAGNATNFLEQAARLAKGGVTDLSVAVDGMTSIINAYGLDQSNANEVADAFFTAQKYGKTTVEELASSIGKVAPIAKAAGMSYQEVLAALSQMTLAGISTEEATTALKGTLTSIIRPSEQAAGVFKELDIPMGEAAFAGGKFGETMEKIKNSTDGNIDKISKLIPNLEGLLGVTSVATKEGLQKYDDILKAVTEDHESLNGAYEKQMATLKEQIETEKNKLIPLKLQTGKILTKVELFWLKLGNAAREVTNIYQQSFGIWGNIVGYMQKLADKISVVTRLKKIEHDKDKQILDEKKQELEQKKTIAEAEVKLEKDTAQQSHDIKKKAQEKEIKADAENKEAKLEAEVKHGQLLLEKDQEFQNQKAELNIIAENARQEFENQKKQFDEMTAADRLKFLTDNIGKERMLREISQIDELVKKGQHEEAKKKMNEMYGDAYRAYNSELVKNLDDRWKNHWDAQVAMAVFGKDMTKDQYQAMGDFFQNIMQLMGKESLAAFRIMQGVAIVNTIVATYESATKAFNSLAGIPFVGPALGGVAAAAAVASGLANVDQIRRQEPPKAETGAYVKTGGLAELHDQEMVLNREQTAALAAGGGVQHIYLQINRETLQSWIASSDEEAERMNRLGMR